MVHLLLTSLFLRILKQYNIDHEIILEIFLNFILSSSEKTKPTFLVPLVCLNHRSTETKFSTRSYYPQNEHYLTLVCPDFWPAI